MEKLVVGDFFSWRSFAEYAEWHYLGLLDELSEDESFSKELKKTIVHQGFNKDGSERYRPTRSKLEHINNTEAINVNSIDILRADIKA